VYAGHFAAGLAIKAKVPSAPARMLGIEKATMTPRVSQAYRSTSSTGLTRWWCRWCGPRSMPVFSGNGNTR